MRIRLGAPLVDIDGEHRVVLSRGKPVIRDVSRETLADAGEPLPTLIENYIRATNPSALRQRELTAMQKVSLCFSRTKAGTMYGQNLPHTHRAFLAATTADLPGLLADSIAKAFLSHFAVAENSWRDWASEGTLSDFKPAARVRLEDYSGLLNPTEPGDTITFESPRDGSAEVTRLTTYRGGISFTREAALNDELAGLAALVRSTAEVARRVEDRLAYDVLSTNPTLADGTPLFDASRNNTTTGAITTASLGAAAAFIEGRQDASGEPLDLKPRRLIVPSTIRADAESVVAATRGAGASVSTSPPIRVVSSGHLDKSSTSQWFLTTGPDQQPAVEVSFLNRQTEPTIEESSDFDNETMRVKVRHDIGAAAIDPRGIVRSTGA